MRTNPSDPVVEVRRGLAAVAQVEAAAGAPVDVWAYSRHTGIEHEVDSYDGTTLGCGPSRGAALVAAKRALAEAAK